MVLDHVEIDVDAIGAQCRDTTLQLFPRAEPGRNSAHLFLRTDVIIVKRTIAIRARMRPGGGFQYRRQPNSRETSTAKLGCLHRQMIPPPRCPGLAVRWRRHGAIAGEFVKPL